jgi:pantoate--beta-alanine ligase
MTKAAEMQKASLQWRRSGKRVVLVPTMGALHEGHAALIRKARELGDRVVVSCYVNPTQFNQRTDYRNYPKRPSMDRKLAKAAGADVLFRPAQLYAPDASTWVEELDRSKSRCGKYRPNHFRGVATVVTKLFGIVQPDVALFGEKDLQQCEVVERMVRDFFLPVRIVRHPIVRERDGLAMSSRNLRLSRHQRELAGFWALSVHAAARQGAACAKGHLQKLLRRVAGVKLEYAEVLDGHLCAAAWVGRVRLIDNRKCGLK